MKPLDSSKSKLLSPYSGGGGEGVLSTCARIDHESLKAPSQPPPAYGERARKLAIALALALTTSFVFLGCIGAPSNPAATQPVTVKDLATTQPAYWYQQPTSVTISSDHFDTLWDACDKAARDFLFDIDRTDYRSGVLTTKPLTSRQWFEFWRPDVRTIYTLERSSIAAMRRTVRFEFARLPDGTFNVSPKVLIEREVIAEQRITSVVNYGSIYQRPLKLREAPRGTKESDEGNTLPSRYWYPVGRDAALEDAIGQNVRERIADALDRAPRLPTTQQ